jgi:hypothetical protein
MAVVVQQAISTEMSSLSARFEDGLAAHAYRLAAVAGIALAAGAAYLLVRQAQQAGMVAQIANLMQAVDRRPLAIVPTTVADGRTRLAIQGLGAGARPTSLVEDYLSLDVECAAERDAIVTGVYDQATSPRERLNVPCSSGARHWTLFWPVYQRPPASLFRWFELDPGTSIRIRAVRRLEDLHRIRLLLKLAVPDDFARRPWYQMLQPRFFIDPLVVLQSA